MKNTNEELVTAPTCQSETESESETETESETE